MAHSLRRRRRQDPLDPLEGNALKPTTLPSDGGLSIAVVLVVVAFRMVNALLVRTYFVPDEYWQSTEIAHRLVFGQGYVTWEWIQHIRGCLHPLLFAALFATLKMTGLDSPECLIYAPRLLQGVLCAVCDCFTFLLACRLFTPSIGRLALFCSITSWFNFFCGVRTLANSMETVLTSIALYWWDWGFTQSSSPHIALCWAALACIVRPTSALLWAPLSIIHLFKGTNTLQFVLATVMIGLLALSCSILVDRLVFGEWVIVQYEFLRFNVLNDVAAFYGTHPWHWYLSQGLVTISTTSLPLFLYGAYHNRHIRLTPALCVGWVVFVFSLLGHKEFRFLFPILPLMHCYAGAALDHIKQDPSLKRLFSPLMVLILLVNVPMAVYFSMVHQQGTVSVMHHLRDLYSTQELRKTDMRVHFWMPCHSTPFYSHIHYDLPMRFLTCHPSDEPGYIDEADIFFMDPMAFINTHYQIVPNNNTQSIPTCDRAHGYGLHNVCMNEPDGWSIPSHIVMYDVLWPKVDVFLERHGFRECSRHFHTSFPEGRVGQYVIVACR